MTETDQLPFEEAHDEEALPPPEMAGDFEVPLEPDAPAEKQEFKDTTVWKKWSVSGSVGRFLSVRPWVEAAKVAIDIGETGGNGDGGPALAGHTLVWANLAQLSAYLGAVSLGRGEVIYPADDRQGIPTAEGFAHYGGGNVDGNAVSRILKVHHWGTKDKGYDNSAFVWKCGHFVARVSKTGAFIPDMRKCLSFHSIKVSRREMHELGTVVGLTLTNHASRTETIQWLEEISGRRR